MRAPVLALVALGAAAAAFPTFAQDASADRYGPPPAPTHPGAYRGGPGPGYPEPDGGTPSGAPAALRGRMLSWPGKRDQAAMAPAYAAPMTARASASKADATPAPSPAYAPPASRWRNDASMAGAQPYAARTYPGSVPARQPYAGRAYAQQVPAAQPSPALQTYGAADAARAYPFQPGALAPPRYPGRPAADAPAQDGWRPVFGNAASSARPPVQDASTAPALAGAPNRSNLPTSIYTPASTTMMTPAQRAAAAPPPRIASAAQRYGYDPTQDHQVRFYSVHRAFGLQPDAAPIPPQFFTASADLSEPPGPLPMDRTTTTTTASGARVSHAAPDTSPN